MCFLRQLIHVMCNIMWCSMIMVFTLDMVVSSIYNEIAKVTMHGYDNITINNMGHITT